jgi:hypothetical protein
MKNLIILSLSLIITSCGGGGGGGDGGSDLPAPVPAPVVTLSSSSSSSEVNQEITLTWTSTNSSSCTASGDWAGSKSLSGSEAIKIKKKGDNIFTLSCTGSGGSSSKSVTVSGLLNFTVTAPTNLSDYEPFSISVSDYTLDEGQTAALTVTQSSGKAILFSEVKDGIFSARAPVTYNSEKLVLNVSLSLSDSIEESKEVSIDVAFNNVALKFDDFLEFNPAADIAASLENDNYFIWDIIPFARTETGTVPGGTVYCYPTPDLCFTTPEEGAIPGFIPADIIGGDFDGDGDQDVLWVADIGDRVFKSFGSDEDKSYWSTIHLLFNDGTGRLSEDTTKYDGGEPPRLPAPYHAEVEDFNGDGIDDVFIASFGVPVIQEDNTNVWKPYPHLILMSDGEKHVNRQILQNEQELQDIPDTSNYFAHDSSSGDVDGDGDIDVFMNAVLYFNDGNGVFDIVGLNQKVVDYPCCAPTKEKIDKTHAHASTMGDYNNDGIDDLVILWSALATEDNIFGARTWNNILLGPVDKDNPTYLDSSDWKTLPEPYYGPDNANYNDADSGDVNGDGIEDIVIGSTRKTPYYSGRHVQILISNGDGTFSDETSSRFSYQPRSGLDPSLTGTGIGEGQITLQDWDGDGDLDIIDTQAIYGGADYEIYPRLTLAVNDGSGNFEEVALDYFPNRAQFTLFDNALNWGFDGTKLMIRGGMLDLDGKGHLDYVSQIQATFNAQDNELFSPPQQAFISSFSMISKREPSTGDTNQTESIEVSIESNSSGSGNVYVVDGVQKKSLTLQVGTTYTFTHSTSHPFRFSTTSDGTHANGSEYSTGVTKSSGSTIIVIDASTPTTLYYYCDVHSGMGSDITVN